MSLEPAAPLPTAVIRQVPEDFVVDEIPAYGPSGRGEHLFVTFRKRGLTTIDAVKSLAAALGVDPRGAGYAGMKDRHAVTTQTASFPFPIARGDAEAALANLSAPGLEILSAARHDNKLKPGHLVGNRFSITLRDVAEDAIPQALATLDDVGRRGVPNAFGPQRFGRDGDNPERALAWLAGKERGPRDKREQRLLFSALQSLLFNRVLDRRVADGTWASVLPGDVAKKHDTGGLFLVPLEGPEADDARARAESGAISATGPLFGVKMRRAEGAPGALEQEVLGAAWVDMPRFEALKHLGEGTRRVLRLLVEGLSVAVEPGEGEHSEGRVVARFVLPKGGYATTVLGRAFQLVDASRLPRHDPSQSPSPEGDPPDGDDLDPA